MPQKVPSAELKTASQQDVIAAFGQSDVSSFAIKDRELLDSGHRFVRTQYKQHANAAIEQNILPHTILSTHQTPTTYFLGGPGAEDREVAGQFTDRLGNTFDILESRPPPPTGDYASTAPSSSNRNLERLMGGVGVHDRPKKKSRRYSIPQTRQSDI